MRVLAVSQKSFIEDCNFAYQDEKNGTDRGIRFFLDPPKPSAASLLNSYMC